MPNLLPQFQEGEEPYPKASTQRPSRGNVSHAGPREASGPSRVGSMRTARVSSAPNPWADGVQARLASLRTISLNLGERKRHFVPAMNRHGACYAVTVLLTDCDG